MSVAAIITSLLLLSPLVATALSPVNITDDAPSAYDMMSVFNFPAGILPKGVTGYELDRSTGNFKAFLNGSCSFSLEGSYQLKYKPTITGTISKNKLKNLTGVSVKVLFLWLNIVEVTRSGNELQFSVGLASANFGIENFYECPQCGCGFDCKDKQIPCKNDLLGQNGYLINTCNLIEWLHYSTKLMPHNTVPSIRNHVSIVSLNAGVIS